MAERDELVRPDGRCVAGRLSESVPYVGGGEKRNISFFIKETKMFYYNAGSNEAQHQFIAETETDIAKLPTATAEGDPDATAGGLQAYRRAAFGSIALCVETGDVYILTSDNQWTKVGG